MKRKSTIRKMATLLSVVILSSGICSITAFAGRRDVLVDNSSFAEKIDTGLWSNPDEDVTVKNGTLIFPTDGSEETRLITTGFAKKNERLDELFNASANIKLKTLPQGQKFVFAFGLQSAEAYPGDNGNVEIAFTNQGGVHVAVSAYGDGGTETVLVQPMRCGGMNTNIAVQAKLTIDGKLTLQVAGRTLCNGMALPVSGEGHLGFLQTGQCGAEVSQVNIRICQYETPENPNIEENFDSGAMNTAVFASKTVSASKYYPQALSVQEYKGNNVLMFQRTNLAYIGTKYKYSNFEMTFDVPYMHRTDTKDENDKVIDPKSKSLLVAFGGDSVNHSSYGYTEATDYINFLSNSTISADHGKQVNTKDEMGDYLLYSSSLSDDKGFSAKISVIDAVVTVSVKWMEETQYKDVLTYTLKEGTPTGYIHIWTSGVGNFAIDNIKITNKDKQPQLITVEYTCDTFERPADFAYEEAEMVFREEKKQSDDDDKAVNGWKDYKMILYTAIEGVIILGVSFAVGEIIKRKRNKKVGGTQNEE